MQGRAPMITMRWIISEAWIHQRQSKKKITSVRNYLDSGGRQRA